jgi:hypothetical protein
MDEIGAAEDIGGNGNVFNMLENTNTHTLDLTKHPGQPLSQLPIQLQFRFDVIR